MKTMSSRLKEPLKHWPTLYRLVQMLIWKIRQLKEKSSGLKTGEIAERWWSERHNHDGKDWIMSYWDTRNDPSCFFLAEKIRDFSPLGSIFEIGSNCGPNLYALAKKFPDTTVRGIEINPLAVKIGNELLMNGGITNAKISRGSGEDLSELADKSFDIIFTKAVLVHIGPDKIEGVMKEMMRVARKALILIERHRETPSDQLGLGVRDEYTYPCNWERNYPLLLKRYAPEKQISVSKVPEEVWIGAWYVITVRL